MKRKYLILFILMVALFSVFYKPNPNRKRETYVKYLSKKKFYKKLKNPPNWMDHQIQKDLIFARKHKITQEALKATFNAMKLNFVEAKQDFIRYRIIDNQLYQFFPKNEMVTKREDAFERALKTVLQLKKLPDADFIFSKIDGLPFHKNVKDIPFYYEKNRSFYLVKNPCLQAPIFTRAKSKQVDVGILVPDYYALSELWPKLQTQILVLNCQNLWQEKKQRMHWRGASSKTLRFKLCELSLLHKDLIDAGFAENINDRKLLELKVWKKFDSYSNLQKPYAQLSEQLCYKYLPVLDGVMCTYPGYQWRLLSNSVAFKQESDEMQWFYDALKAYVHYVPIKEDISNILQQINWAIENDEKCKKISENATDFVLNNLMIEDSYVYLYKVINEYAKYQSFDKKKLKRDVKKDPRWVAISNRRKANSKLKREGYEIF